MPETPVNDSPVSEAPAGRRGGRRRRWPWVVGILAIIVAGLIAAVVLALQFADEATDVRADLLAAKSQMTALPKLVRDGDQAAFEAAAAEIEQLTAHADETVDGPLWSVASQVPFVGQNVAAVRGAAQATHILVRDALPASVGVLEVMDFDSIRLEGGGFDLEPFRQAVTALPVINAAFSDAEKRVSGIDRDALLPFVDDAVGELIDVIDESAPLLRTVEEVLPAALQIAGDTEPRSYLVIFQNNAEIRASGGNPAASVLLRIDQGRMTLEAQASSASFPEEGTAGQAYLQLPGETLALYADDFATYSQNFSRTPNFPTTAQLFTTLWTGTTGQNVDGVISVDPVVLSYILGVTGPTTAGDGTEITSANAVKALLSDTYARFGIAGETADAYFASVAVNVFAKVVAGKWDPLEMVEQLRRGVAEQRIYAWFGRENEEAMVRDLGIDGEMTAENAETTQVGIFLNDSGVGKIQYYLSTSVEIECDPSARTATTTLTMANSAPDTELPPYTGSLRAPSYGQPPSTMIMDVLFFAPPGASIADSQPREGDIPEWSRSGTENGRSVSSITVFLERGQTRSVSFTSALPDGPLGPLSERHTPTVTDTPVTIAPSCAELTSP